MSQITLTDTILQNSEQQKLPGTGDAKETVHTNIECLPSQLERNKSHQK